MRERERERERENLKVREGLGASWRLSSVVQDRGKTVGARGLMAWVISVGDSKGEETEERNRGYMVAKKERKRRGTHMKGIEK